MLETQSLLDDYRILRVLGVGGFGITYLAEDETLRIRVAIKEFMPGHLATHDGTTVRPIREEKQRAFEKELDNFITEARNVARIHHPNIVRVRRCFKRNGSAYMVMDFEEGQSFEEQLRQRDQSPSERELRSMLEPFLDGLKAVHDQGLVHRDIKPSNIYLRHADGSPVLLDFGAAREQAASHFTAILTKGYAPIEQYDKAARQGPWTDIYGVAAMLYRAVTGGKPLPALSRMANDTLVPAQERAAGAYSPEFLKGIDWGLAVAPEDRPRNVDAWRSVLLSGHLDAAPPATPVAVPSPKHERPADPNIQSDDEAAWRTAKAADIMSAYLGYLRDFPNGLYRVLADRAVEEIRRKQDEEERTDPDQARSEEEDRPKKASAESEFEVFGRIIDMKPQETTPEDDPDRGSAPTWQDAAVLGFLGLIITILSSIVFRGLIGTNPITLAACFVTTFAAALIYCFFSREYGLRMALLVSGGTALASLILFVLLVVITG